jgi:hypothetical protein
LADLGIRADRARAVCASQCVGLRFAVGGGSALQSCELVFCLLRSLFFGLFGWAWWPCGGRACRPAPSQPRNWWFTAERWMWHPDNRASGLRPRSGGRRALTGCRLAGLGQSAQLIAMVLRWRNRVYRPSESSAGSTSWLATKARCPSSRSASLTRPSTSWARDCSSFQATRGRGGGGVRGALHGSDLGRADHRADHRADGGR